MPLQPTDLMIFNSDDNGDGVYLSPSPMFDATINGRHQYGDEYHQSTLFTAKELEEFRRYLLKL